MQKPKSLIDFFSSDDVTYLYLYGKWCHRQYVTIGKHFDNQNIQHLDQVK